MKKTNFASRSLVLLLTVLLALSLTACNAKGGEKMDNMGGGMSAMMDEPKNAEEATAMHKELTAQENEILSKNTELWEKVFMAADKGMTLQAKTTATSCWIPSTPPRISLRRTN